LRCHLLSGSGSVEMQIMELSASPLQRYDESGMRKRQAVKGP
jgi:hypothetical protein